MRRALIPPPTRITVRSADARKRPGRGPCCFRTTPERELAPEPPPTSPWACVTRLGWLPIQAALEGSIPRATPAANDSRATPDATRRFDPSPLSGRRRTRRRPPRRCDAAVAARSRVRPGRPICRASQPSEMRDGRRGRPAREGLRTAPMLHSMFARGSRRAGLRRAVRHKGNSRRTADDPAKREPRACALEGQGLPHRRLPPIAAHARMSPSTGASLHAF